MRSDDEPRNGRPVRKKLGVKIKGTGQSDPQPIAPVSPSVQFNTNIGLGQPQFQGTGGGNPRAGRLPPPTEKPDLLYPDPIESKGGDDVGLEFVRELEKQKQLDPITGEKYTLDQKRIQAQGLQQGNFITVPFKLSSFATGTNNYIQQAYNTAVGVGDQLTDFIQFNDYYNVLGLKINFENTAINDAMFEFYLMQRVGADSADATLDGLQKIPVQVQRTLDNTNVTFNVTDDEFNFEKIQVYYTGDGLFNFGVIPNLSPRTYGLALSRIHTNFPTSFDTSSARINGVIYLDKSTAGQNL